MNDFFAIMGLPAGAEIWVILIIVLLLFGGAKIPQLMRGMGKGMGEFKKGIAEGKKEFDSAAAEPKDEPSEPKQ